MNKTTNIAVSAFLSDRPIQTGNSSVTIENDSSVGKVVYLRLSGNVIARKLPAQNVFFEITNAGYNIATTRERLNGLPGVKVHVKKGILYLNGEIWDGKWKHIYR